MLLSSFSRQIERFDGDRLHAQRASQRTESTSAPKSLRSPQAITKATVIREFGREAVVGVQCGRQRAVDRRRRKPKSFTVGTSPAGGSDSDRSPSHFIRRSKAHRDECPGRHGGFRRRGHRGPRADDARATCAVRRPIDAPFDVVLLSANRDGIEQISEYLAGREHIAAMHILSHANAGTLTLGTSELNAASLSHYADQLAGWSAALTDDADVLLYGCNLAQDGGGVKLIDRLSAVTGADIAASDDVTGSAALGGDWNLEYATGDIAASPLILADTLFHGVLVTGNTSGSNTAVAESSDLSASSTIILVDAVHTLDLSGLDKDLLITVRNHASDNTRSEIQVSESNAGGNPLGNSVTYSIKNDGGNAATIKVGRTNRTVIVKLQTGLKAIDVTSVAGTPSGAATPTGLQIALGRKQADLLTWLDSPSRLAIVFENGGQLDSVVAGKSADTNSVQLFVGPDTQIATLKRGTGFSGKLKLKYPGSDSRRTRAVDLRSTGTYVRGIGRLDNFSGADFQEVETAGGGQEVGVVGQSNVVVTTGAGEDVLIAGGGSSQTLQGGDDADAYVLEGPLGNQAISIVEAVDGGTGDKLDLTNLTNAATVEIHPVLLTTNADPPAGSKGIQLAVDATNKVADIAYVEGIKSQNATVFQFYDDWGYSQSTNAEEEHVFTIEAAPDTGTLDFESVTHDLHFELLGDGEVHVTATQTHGATQYRYTVKAEGIAAIKGGQGRNTYSVVSDDSLSGAITTSSGGTNILNYSQYRGTRPVAVDLQQKSATGLLTASYNATPTNEIQQLTIADAVGGSFALSLGAAVTASIGYDTDANTTATNIETALNALSTGLVTVTAGAAGVWNIQFNQAVDVPQLIAIADSLVSTSGQTATANVVTGTPGITADAANGIDRIDGIEGGHTSGQPSILLGPGGVPTAGGSANDILFVSTLGSDLQGLAGNDLLVGGAGQDRLAGNAGHDFLAGGAENDQLSGGAGNDTLLSGSGDDRLLGEAGNDHLVAESGGGDLLRRRRERCTGSAERHKCRSVRRTRRRHISGKKQLGHRERL